MKIKYRVWDNENKSYDDPYSYAYYAMTQDGGLDFYCHGDHMDSCDPDKYIVEQFTGLLDKNGKEIYEGDIIQETIITDDTTDGTYRYEVYWDEDTLCWSIKGISKIDYNLRDDLWETNQSREVIGNIHEPIDKNNNLC